MDLEHEDLTARVIGKAVGRQHGSPLNITKAPSNPSTSLILEAFPALLHSSFGMSERAESARERNGFEECAEADYAGMTLDFRQPTLAPHCKEGKRTRGLDRTSRDRHSTVECVRSAGSRSNSVRLDRDLLFFTRCERLPSFFFRVLSIALFGAVANRSSIVVFTSGGSGFDA